jgi:transposase-like protein
MLLPGLLWAGQDRGVPVEREGSLLASCCADREKGSEAVSPVAIVWPCPLAVDAYLAAGRDVGFPRPACPSCAGPLVFWSGYRRYVREAGRCRKIFVPRLRCARCGASHALLPAFTLAWRLDTAETVGTVITEVADGACGVRPAAERAGVPYTTARGWVRRFRARAPELGVGFAALAVELGGQAVTPPAGAGRFALAAIGAAFAAAAGLPGWRRRGARRFASSVTGGRLIAASTVSPWFTVGRRRFMPPIPP